MKCLREEKVLLVVIPIEIVCAKEILQFSWLNKF